MNITEITRNKQSINILYTKILINLIKYLN